MKQTLLILMAVALVGCGPKKGGMEGTWATDEHLQTTSTIIVREFLALKLDGSCSWTRVNIRREEGFTGDMGSDWTRTSTYYIKDGVIHVDGGDGNQIDKYLIRGDGNIEWEKAPSKDFPRLYKKQP